MADDVVRPQDVLEGGLRDKLKDAVISAYMATSVIGEASGHSIKRFVQLQKDGDGLRFDYEASILGENYPVYCKYPSGDWKLDVKLLGLNVLPDPGGYPGFTSIDATGRWEDLKADVDAWLDPWVNDCPNPNSFKNQIYSMARIASQLNIGGSAGNVGPPGGDTDLREAVKGIGNRAYGKGDAMVAFRDAYSSDLWTTINNQCGMTAAAGLALTAEGAAWSESYKTLRNLVGVAINDFNSLADADGSTDFDPILGATSAVAGLLGATVGAVYPGFGAAMGGLSAVIGAYTVMTPSIPAIDVSALQLSGGDYPAMWESFCTQVRAISTDLANAEQAVARGCRAVVADTNQNPESYSLTKNTKKGTQYDDFGAIRTDEIDIKCTQLKEMSGMAELIGDQQIELAGFVLGDDARGNPSATVQNEWYRGVLPDGTRIGLETGYGHGPCDAYTDLIAALAILLKTEGNNSHRMAEALMRTALDFGRTDNLSQADMRRLNKQIDQQAAPLDHNPLVRGNDPTDDWYTKYAQ